MANLQNGLDCLTSPLCLIQHLIVFLSLSSFQERRTGARSNREGFKERIMERRVTESGDSSGYESSVQTNRSLLKKQETDEEPQHTG